MGDESPDAIYTAVGKATTAWQAVEYMLATAVANWADMQLTLFIKVYANQPSLGSKLRMAAIIAEHRFERRAEERLVGRKIISLVEKFSEIRNDIAHGQISERQSGFFSRRDFLHIT